MKHFLEFVAEDVLNKYGRDLSHITVVFPNKRSRIFFNQYITNVAGGPIWSPNYLTISELFGRHSALAVADKLKLVCDLYRCYLSCMPETDESLDEFYSWGELLLSDFDDIDKSMVDTHQLFSNLEALGDLQRTDYLTEEQINVLRHFFQTFSAENTALKKRFSSLWQQLENIYTTFNTHLREQGLAYEGALYRHVVESDTQWSDSLFLFVGFNLLSEVEKRLFTLLKMKGAARFYWDFDWYYMPTSRRDTLSEAGVYISDYLNTYPNELNGSDAAIYDNFSREKQISFVAFSTEHAQGRFVAEWLNNEQRRAAGNDTAVVLCDENLLPTVLHSIPPEVEKLNITAGIPLSRMPISTFVYLLYDFRTLGMHTKTETFKRRYVLKLLRHPFMDFLSEETQQILETVQSDLNPAVTPESLKRDPVLSDIFAYTDTETRQHTGDILRWLICIMNHLGKALRESEDVLFKESVFNMYKLLCRLETLVSNGDLPVNSTTLLRLIRQIVTGTTIPFHGEPAQGVQLLGMLETRNLDFKHLILLSCNEDKIPRMPNQNSVVPYTLRKAFGMNTRDHISALYSYHFHRLLQRAEDITLAYNNATSDVSKNEMSRYMLQLLVESGKDINHLAAITGQNVQKQERKAIEKTERIKEKLSGIKRLSPSAINKYLRCPLQFYYSYIEGLKEPNTDENTTESRLFGTLFHEAAQNIYNQMLSLDAVKREDAYKHIDINKALTEALRNNGLLGKDGTAKQLYGGLNLIGQQVLLTYLRRLVRNDSINRTDIIAMESPVSTTVDISLPNGTTRKVEIYGIVDRLDAPQTETAFLRVLDYKTGNPRKRPVNSIEEIFTPQGIDTAHADYYLQALLYSIIVRHTPLLNPKGLPVIPSLLFIRKLSPDNPWAVLYIGKEPINDIAEVEQEFMNLFRELVGEIFDPDIPFTPTQVVKFCDTCPYARICKEATLADRQ